MGLWYFEGYLGQGGALQKLPLRSFPQLIGRDDSADCPITSPCVSRSHARVEQVNGKLFITDLNSSNGTFVNHERIRTSTALDHGDVVHFGDLEFRIIDADHANPNQSGVQNTTGSQTVFLNAAELSNTFPAGVRELEALIAAKLVEPAFQKILHADGLRGQGYEVLGRGASPVLSPSPLTLFSIAESVGLEIQLSELFRQVGIEHAAKYKLQGEIWINTHPSEMKQPDQLLASLSELRKTFPKIPLIFEVHEQCVADVGFLKSFKHELHKLGIRFAFDDFGVGQSRLMELVEAKPDIIKFDKVLIENIDAADQARINFLGYLKNMASALGIAALAECVETQDEYTVLQSIGFDLYQGYFFAKPLAAKDIR